jgi:AraC-like DNA-binding protein
MTIRFVWLFLELVPRREKLELIEQIQARFGLAPEQFSDPDTRVPLQVAIDLLDEAQEQTRAPNVGLVAAERMTLDHLGVIEFLARSKTTLGEALECLAHYARLLAEGMHLLVERRSDVTNVRLWFDSNLVLPPATYEFAAATLLRSARRISGNPKLKPVELHLMGPPPMDVSLHAHLFDCNLCFNMPVTQIVLDSQLLDLPLPHAEPVLGQLLQSYANTLMNSLPRNDGLVATVRDLLTAEIELRDARAGRIARRLGISVRTLARRLGECGTTYRELVNEARRQIALRDLAQTLRPIDDIAIQLGFASSQSFHRAFRRWTGDTAASYRERSRRAGFLQDRA